MRNALLSASTDKPVRIGCDNQGTLGPTEIGVSGAKHSPPIRNIAMTTVDKKIHQTTDFPTSAQMRIRRSPTNALHDRTARGTDQNDQSA